MAEELVSLLCGHILQSIVLADHHLFEWHSQVSESHHMNLMFVLEKVIKLMGETNAADEKNFVE